MPFLPKFLEHQSCVSKLEPAPAKLAFRPPAHSHFEADALHIVANRLFDIRNTEKGHGLLYVRPRFGFRFHPSLHRLRIHSRYFHHFSPTCFRRSATCRWPSSSAHSRAVLPLSFLTVTSGPAASSRLTVSVRPLRAAASRAVSEWLFFPFRFAPLGSSSDMTSDRPSTAAYIRASSPSPSRALTLAPASIRSFAIST